MSTATRGFASQTPERLKEITRKGGKASASSKNPGHRFTAESGREAGAKSLPTRRKGRAEK